MRTDRKWWPASCNCEECQAAPRREPVGAAIVGDFNVLLGVGTDGVVLLPARWLS